ncbi:hypothetical protein F5Y05DRAFT_407825 [Hypoxylon sp. FL0543]|nr:hypothetical protein F5Y05DRAFT_407825 [Hypoxylon sp. FL0543]
MAPSQPNRGLPRSMTTSFSTVSPMFRRLFSRRRNRSRERDEAASPFVADDESSRPPGAAQSRDFDKRCVVTFEGGRGTIRVVEQSFLQPDPRAPATAAASNAGLSAGSLEQEPSYQSREPQTPVRGEKSLPPLPQQQPPPSVDDINDVVQRMDELSRRMDAMYDTLCEGFQRMDAKLNRMHALIEAAAVKTAAHERLRELRAHYQ